MKNEIVWDTLLNAIACPLFIFKDETVLFFNAAAQQLTGYLTPPLLHQLVHAEYFHLLSDPSLVPPSGLEIVLQTVTQTSCWVEWSVRPVRYRDQDAWLGTAVDITKHKQIEETLHQHREQAHFTSDQVAKRLQSILQAANVGIWIWDIRTGKTIWSSENYRILGYQAGECEPSYENWLHAVHPDDRDQMHEYMQSVEHDPSVNKEYRVLWPDGSIHWLNDIATTFYDVEGQPEQKIGIALDITQRKQAEMELYESNTLFQSLFHHSPDAIFLLNLPSHLIVDCNRAACSINGYTREELIGQSIDILNVDPGDQHVRRLYVDRMRRDGVIRYETNHRRKDGSMFPIEVSTCLITGTNSELILGIDRDITERKRAEAALRESNERFETLFRYSPDAIFLMDFETLTIVDCNEVACQMNGYTREELIGQSINLLNVTPESEEVSQNLKERLRHEGLLRLQQKHRRKDGSIFTIDNSVCHLTIAGRELMMGIDRDITERQLAEAALHESNERFQSLFQHSPDAIFLLDPSTNTILDCNEAACRMNGYAREELIGQAVDTLNVEGWDEETKKHYLDRMGREGRIWSEIYHRRKDGSRFPLESLVCLITVAGRELAMRIDRDITERQQIQKALLEQERLTIALQKEQEIGELKTKIMQRLSHELRTPLAIIGTSRDLLDQYGDRMSVVERQNRLGQIRYQVHRLSNMLTDLERTAKGVLPPLRFQPVLLNLQSVAEELVNHLGGTVGMDHHLLLETQGDLHQVMVDKGQVETILVNLLSNAIKYSPQNSTIKLNLKIEDSEIVLQVADEGIGITPEDHQHIFEPFYRGTNSNNISGLGLGLSIVKDAVDLHGGTISVESSGQGTTFTVRLPLQRPTDRITN